MSEAADAAAEGPLAEAVAELYALLPGDFTAARNARAAAAGRNGEKDLAQRIKALSKPSAAAWLVNMLTRHRREELDSVLELGAALREAQEDLDPREMRRLSTERQRLLRAMARDAQQLAAELGQQVSNTVAGEAEQTLWAAMTDADAAAVVASGQLVRPLTASGWGSVEVDGAVAVPGLVQAAGAPAGKRSRTAPAKRPSRQEKASARSAEEKRRRAEQARALRAAKAELADAEQQAGRAEEEFSSLQADVDALGAERDAVSDDLEDLREQLRRLEQELAGLDRRAGTLERRRDTARRAARAAGRAVERARQRVEELDDGADG